MKVTDFDLKTLALANRNSANALANFKRADSVNARRSKINLSAACAGWLGMGAGYAVGLSLHLPVSVCSALGCVAMLGLSLVLARAQSSSSFEARMEENKAAMQEVLARIRALPKNAPSEVREELWQIYRSLNVELPGNHSKPAVSATPAPVAMTSGPNLNLPLTPAANTPHIVKTLPTSSTGAPPLTPEQKHAANMALKKALARVEEHALEMAMNNAEQQGSLESRLQTRQPMEWKQEKREIAPEAKDHAWLEDAGETVFATSGEVFQANQKTVRSVVFPRMNSAG